jgi:hypothetical protein
MNLSTSYQTSAFRSVSFAGLWEVCATCVERETARGGCCINKLAPLVVVLRAAFTKAAVVDRQVESGLPCAGELDLAHLD